MFPCDKYIDNWGVKNNTMLRIVKSDIKEELTQPLILNKPWKKLPFLVYLCVTNKAVNSVLV